MMTLILWCFAAQSLALAVAPACDQGTAPHGGHADMMMASDAGSDTSRETGDGMHDGGHGDMPCCQDSVDASHQDLCQLTCSVGGCSAAAAVTQSWQINALPATAPFQPISPSPLTASPRNLLRPPIGA